MINSNKSSRIRLSDKYAIGEENSKLFLIHLDEDEKCFEVKGICIQAFHILKDAEKNKTTVGSFQEELKKLITKSSATSDEHVDSEFEKSFNDLLNYLIEHDLVIID